MAFPKAQSTSASIESVLAKMPAALANCRTRLAWTRLTLTCAPTQRLDQHPLVAPAGFTNHLHSCFHLLDPFDELPMARCIVGQTTLLTSNRCVQVGLGHIHS